MGSTSDWETMKAAAKVLEEFGVAYEAKAMSAHRTPHAVAEWAAGAQKNGMKAIIAAAGGAAHLAGVVAAHTTLPVLGVPMPSKHLQGLDSLLSTVQMPKGIPVATFAIGEAGAANAALFAVALLALSDPALQKKLTTSARSRPKRCSRPRRSSCEFRGPPRGADPARRRTRRLSHRNGLRPRRRCVEREGRRAPVRRKGPPGRPSGDRAFRFSRRGFRLGTRSSATARESSRKRFWPGPLTLILKRSALAKDFVTGGQDTRRPARAVASGRTGNC